jgi:hypothetical protein
VRDDDVDLETNELVSQPAKTLWLALSRAELKLNVLSLDVAVLAQAGSERAQERFRIGGNKYTDPRQLCLLRMRRERPRCRCAADERDELAAPDAKCHLIPPAGRATEG